MEDNQANSDLKDLQAQCKWLRMQVQITLILLIMVSGVLTLFLRQQDKYTNNDLNSVRPMIEEYTKTQAPMMDDFVKRLMEYGKTHPDFNAIYKKYGLDQLKLADQTNAPKK